MKQSAVEWLAEQFEKIVFYSEEAKKNTIKQAKEMHKQEIEDAFYTEQIDEFGDEVTFEEYYNETYNK